jgi:GT2 family glycosyltransferase
MVLRSIPDGSDLICFHGKPRIFAAGESSVSIDWVRHYINQRFVSSSTAGKTVTVIIPYNKDRGWLKDAVASVPGNIQLILSKGDGNWPQNFNKVLDQVEGDYVRWLHEDDMLTPNSIDDSILAIEKLGVDFIHGNAIEITPEGKTIKVYRPRIQVPSLSDLTKKNVFHSAAMMYRRRVFDELKGLNEDKTLYGFEELEFNLRCLKAGYKVGYCDAELGIYRRHPGQIIRTVNAAMRNTNRAELIKSYS